MQLRWWWIALLAIGCNTDRKPPDGPCPNGICIVDGGTSCGACNTPPAPSCTSADLSIVFDTQGTCSMGQCSYKQNQISCPGACNQATGLCPDPCNGITCNDPPATGACYTVPGTCTNGACSYVETGVVCNSPPANECTGNNLRTYTSAGASCPGGACDYPFSDTTCSAGCANGACIGNCDEAGCQPWALPNQPNGTRVRSCTDTNCPTVMNLPALDEPYFRCNLQPILNTSCAQLGCHSDQTPLRRMRIYARLLSRADPNAVDGAHEDGAYNLATCVQDNCDVNPLSTFEWAWNFDTLRMLAAEAPASSNELVTQPLAVSAGGLVHDGFDIFQSTNDVRYQAFISWMNGATDTNNCGGRQLPANAGSVVSLDEYTPNSCVR